MRASSVVLQYLPFIFHTSVILCVLRFLVVSNLNKSLLIIVNFKELISAHISLCSLLYFCNSWLYPCLSLRDQYMVNKRHWLLPCRLLVLCRSFRGTTNKSGSPGIFPWEALLMSLTIDSDLRSCMPAQYNQLGSSPQTHRSGRSGTLGGSCNLAVFWRSEETWHY